MAVRPADQKRHVGRAAVEVAPQQLGEGLARQRLAALVENDGEALGGRARRHQLGFLRHAGRGARRPAISRTP